jgi:hypothetical protein
MSAELLHSNSCYTVVCLHSCYLAMGVHVTICTACGSDDDCHNTLRAGGASTADSEAVQLRSCLEYSQEM